MLILVFFILSIVHMSGVEPPSNTADMSGEEANTVRADGVDGGDRLRLGGGIICLAKQSVYLLPITLINARHIAIQHHHRRFF